jgi:phosphoglycolate phosphatase-like HAD superfamily hydrolase
MRISNIILDFDDTLVPSSKIKKSIMSEYFYRMTDDKNLVDQLLGNGGMNRYQIFDYILKDMNNFEQFKAEFFQDLDTKVDSAIARLPEEPFATELLELSISKGINCFLSSATPKANLERIIEFRKWKVFFKRINGSPISKIKFISNLVSYGYDTNNFVIFGDGNDDMLSAKAFNIEFIRAGKPGAIKNLIDRIK